MTDCIVLFQRDESFDTHEVGAYEIVIVTGGGNARGVQLTRSEALSIYMDMQVEFDE